ncbi:class I SAM-dependent methyltransferase [Alcaligenaceae bacterium LF4-65]|uniref:Class I SAM-dependent methyltransferase n=1 Tax=Zwartia hollandica TaxID=324606 RepID=A0A953N9J8_9BURK|nr:class I SAM-dependent methyltransferase [Zwartia hollandica]MBZ1351040.1 class I SAM-dependent methyltransferase [Zwartia hollandica]
MIDPQDVVNAYRLILGREPESQESVNRYATELSDLNALRDMFLSSNEFRQKFEHIHAPKRSRRGFYGPVMKVELKATDEQLAMLYVKTAAQWHHLGETEPYWSVITQESYLQSHFQQSREVFYATGEQEIQLLDSTLERHFLEHRPLGRCIELGCGVGRVTAALAKRYQEVIAVDISEPHLRLAEQELSMRGVSNVTYQHLTSLEQTEGYGPIDLFYSKIVLQHNPPPVMDVLLKNLLTALRPGGIGFFQIPVFKAGYKFLLESYLQEDNQTDMEMHFFPQAELLNLVANAGCRVCELYEDDSIGASASMVSNTLLVQKLD